MQDLINDDAQLSQLQAELAFVHKHFSEVPKLIYKLEDNKATFLKAAEIVDLVAVLFRLAVNECKPEERVKAQKVLDKLQSGLSENKVFDEIRKICQHDLNSSLNFAAIHSMDCERFSLAFG